eukprot:TRINITY_DN10607_c0_g1_i2.p1 TRINITY_DN10607_c0_g1~~TRINITY_DN10607_c0_g1_i2.p1  ORF type:complete len:230 (+),score=37.51 TRINITY_DN10607_c0_g1_i2:44-733(+)
MSDEDLQYSSAIDWRAAFRLCCEVHFVPWTDERKNWTLDEEGLELYAPDSGGHCSARCEFINSGSVYVEFDCEQDRSHNTWWGCCFDDTDLHSCFYSQASQKSKASAAGMAISSDGQVWHGGPVSAKAFSYKKGDIIGVFIDTTAHTLSFYCNGYFQLTHPVPLPARPVAPAVAFKAGPMRIVSASTRPPSLPPRPEISQADLDALMVDDGLVAAPTAQVSAKKRCDVS